MITAGGLPIGREKLHTLKHPAVSSHSASQDFRNSGSEPGRAGADAAWLSLAFFSPLSSLQGLQLPVALSGQTES